MKTESRLTRRELLSLTPAQEPADLVHIASLLVQATERGCEAVRAKLRSLDCVEIHETASLRKLAIVLESTSDRDIGAVTTDLQDIVGVLSVSVVAHVVESEAALREEHGGE